MVTMCLESLELATLLLVWCKNREEVTNKLIEMICDGKYTS